MSTSRDISNIRTSPDFEKLNDILMRIPDQDDQAFRRTCDLYLSKDLSNPCLAIVMNYNIHMKRVEDDHNREDLIKTLTSNKYLCPIERKHLILRTTAREKAQEINYQWETSEKVLLIEDPASILKFFHLLRLENEYGYFMWAGANSITIKTIMKEENLYKIHKNKEEVATWIKQKTDLIVKLAKTNIGSYIHYFTLSLLDNCSKEIKLESESEKKGFMSFLFSNKKKLENASEFIVTFKSVIEPYNKSAHPFFSLMFSTV